MTALGVLWVCHSFTTSVIYLKLVNFGSGVQELVIYGGLHVRNSW